MVDREGEQPELVVVRPVAIGRTRAAIASFAEIVDRCVGARSDLGDIA
jgi:hypothetical protein